MLVLWPDLSEEKRDYQLKNNLSWSHNLSKQNLSRSHNLSKQKLSGYLINEIWPYIDKIIDRTNQKDSCY